MASRTLASISGRSVGHTKDASYSSSEPTACGSQRPRKHVKKLMDDPPPAKTETVYSDDPAPASSGVFAPNIPRFSLEKSFPSILSTVSLIHGVRACHSLDSLLPLSQVFLTCLDTIVISMADLPYGVRFKPEYEVAQFTVSYARALLKEVLDPQVAAGKVMTLQYLATIKHVDTVVATLRSFLRVAERVFAENKPLPDVPSRPTDPPTSLIYLKEEPESLLHVVEDVLKNEEAPACAPSRDGTAALRKSETGAIIAKVVRRRAKMRSLASQFTASTITLVDSQTSDKVKTDSSAQSAKETSRAEEHADMPYLPRQSAIYYLADPYNPDVDVDVDADADADVTLPAEDSNDVRLDDNGVMKAASLPALVRILTSMQGVTDREFIPTFFVCFRFFASPRLFLEELIRRFMKTPPEGLSSKQLNGWIRNRVCDRIRIGKTVLLWLELYWKPDADTEVLPDLQTFVIDELVRGIPPLMAEAVLEAVDLVNEDNPLCRRLRKVHDLGIVYRSGGEVVLPRNNFQVMIEHPLETTVQLLTFNSPAGREQFARQLTVRVSSLFHQVDPEDAVKYWHLKEQKSDVDDLEVSKILKAIIELERSLCSWVTFTILDEMSPTTRRILLEFWLDVSARCMRLRNYSSAHCILVGLSNGAITRLKHMVLAVSSSSKIQFQVLQKFFGGQDNYACYPPFIRDVVSALNVVPTSVAANDSENTGDKMINLCSYRIVLKTVRAMESCLIPYNITKSDAFDSWIGRVLAAFPSELEAELNDKFYDQR
ncbi:hypothetical protein DXG01_006776 [Tephrocybe rancida]|nr:hypothetical protein DXG01_006776 [Tephrocybe rancida]